MNARRATITAAAALAALLIGAGPAHAGGGPRVLRLGDLEFVRADGAWRHVLRAGDGAPVGFAELGRGPSGGELALGMERRLATGAWVDVSVAQPAGGAAAVRLRLRVAPW